MPLSLAATTVSWAKAYATAARLEARWHRGKQGARLALLSLPPEAATPPHLPLAISARWALLEVSSGRQLWRVCCRTGAATRIPLLPHAVGALGDDPVAAMATDGAALEVEDTELCALVTASTVDVLDIGRGQWRHSLALEPVTRGLGRQHRRFVALHGSQLLAACSSTGRVALWNALTGERLAWWTMPVGSVALAVDWAARRLCAFAVFQPLLANGQPRADPGDDDNDSSWLELRALDSGRLEAASRSHDDRLLGAAFDPWSGGVVAIAPGCLLAWSGAKDAPLEQLAELDCWTRVTLAVRRDRLVLSTWRALLLLRRDGSRPRRLLLPMYAGHVCHLDDQLVCILGRHSIATLDFARPSS